MTRDNVVELRLLGPFEAWLGDEPLSLGGAKQRAVLATLLLHTDEVVSQSTVIDEVWGDDPPVSAGHSLEVYVSRLRRLLGSSGLRFTRRGSGYVAELGGAVLDIRQFERLADGARAAAAEGDHEAAAATSAFALSLWRGEVAADVALGPVSRSAAARLEGLRLGALEVRFDAALALGRHDEAVGELQTVVDRNPFRERFVAQLMVVLYRCGRQADALAVYERLRARLDDELGLQPSAELRQLSARIVRQEPELQAPAPSERLSPARAAERRARRVTRLVAAGVATAAVMALTASGSAPRARGLEASLSRVAIVLPSDPAASAFDESNLNSRMTWTAAGFARGAANHRLHAETLRVDERAPDAAEIARLLRRIDAEGFDLVLLPGDRASARLIAPEVVAHPRTRFVFVDTSLADLALEGVHNASALRFSFEHPAKLAGAASGLVLARRKAGGAGAGRISVVAGVADSETRRVVDAFRAGVQTVLPAARVRVDYAGETTDPTPCEHLANEQINGGAEIILVIAGRCGLGASAVIHARRVWFAGEDEYGVADHDPLVIASMFKDWNKAAETVVEMHLQGMLPPGADLALGLQDYATGMTMSSVVPAAAQSDVVELCSRVRQEAARAAL